MSDEIKKDDSKTEKIIEVFCDMCSNEAEGTKRQLQLWGWEITVAYALCPTHSEMV